MNRKFLFLPLLFAIMSNSRLMAKTPDSLNSLPSHNTIHCKDESTVKQKLADSGIDLLLEKAEAKSEYLATLTKMGYVGTVLKKITVTAEERDKKIVFTGHELKLIVTLNQQQQPKIATLDATGEEPEKSANQKKIWPIHEKMICSFSGK